MYAGTVDDLANPTDTRNLRDNVKTVKKYVELEDFDHGSFLLGKNMTFLNDVVEIMDEYNAIYFD